MGLENMFVVGMAVLVCVVLAFAFCVFQFMQKIILDERMRHSHIERELLNRIMAGYATDLRNYTQAVVQQEAYTNPQDEADLRQAEEDFRKYGEQSNLL